jgi:hypothetical protein
VEASGQFGVGRCAAGDCGVFESPSHGST